IGRRRKGRVLIDDPKLPPAPAPGSAGAEQGEDDSRRARRARKARRRRSFGVGILFTFAILLLVVTVAVFIISGTFVHYTAMSSLEEELARRIQGIAALAAETLAKENSEFVKNAKGVGGGRSARARDVVRQYLARVRAQADVRDVLVLSEDGQ